MTQGEAGGRLCMAAAASLVVAGCGQPSASTQDSSSTASAASAPPAASAASTSPAPSSSAASSATTKGASASPDSDTKPLTIRCSDWKPWVAFAPDCGFFAAASKATLPTPLRWGRCPAAFGGDRCRALHAGDHAKLAVHAVHVTQRGSGALIGSMDAPWPCESTPTRAEAIIVADLVNGEVGSALVGKAGQIGCSLSPVAITGAAALLSVMGDKPQEQVDDTGFAPPSALLAVQRASLEPQIVQRWPAGTHQPQILASPRWWGARWSR